MNTTDLPDRPVNLSTNCTMPYDQDRVALLSLYSVVLVVGVPANIATIWMTWREVRRENVLGVYLFILSICDLMYLATLPLWAAYISNGHIWYWGSILCKWTGYIFFNNMYISIFLLCCVSVDRYVAVVYSLESRGIRQLKYSWIITMAIVTMVALGHLPVFIMDEGNTDGEIKRCFEPGQATAMVTCFNYARFLIGFLIPLLILVFTNRSILSSIQDSSGTETETKDKVRWLAPAVVILFLVCFAPYHIILLTRAIGFHAVSDKCRFDQHIYTPYSIFLGLSTINSAMNPILYVLSNESVRKEVWRGLSRVWRQRQHRNEGQG